uniref:Uncharacterized protein n=1 Tax=viral metagenome TaxID=1070528 RepID=A0A6C0F9P6_9ZZZZ
MLPQCSPTGQPGKIMIRNRLDLIQAIQNANIFEKSQETYIINNNDITVDVYRSKVGVSPNSVFENENGPIFYLKSYSEFTDEECSYFINMFEKIKGKRKIYN